MQFMIAQSILMVIGGIYVFVNFPILERCPFYDSTNKEKMFLTSCLWPAIIPAAIVFAVGMGLAKVMGHATQRPAGD